MALLPFRRKSYSGFLRLWRNSSAPAGFEPAYLGSCGEDDNHGITGGRPTFFVAWYQLSNILVKDTSSLFFQPILYAHLQLIVPKCFPPTTVSYEERVENHRALSTWRMMVGDETLPIENASEASLLKLQYVAEHCHGEGQYLRTTFLVACSE